MTNTKIASLFWIHALSPLHVGSGRGLGYIDLPITREKVTNYPYIPGSAVKGVFADHHGATDDKRKGDSLKEAAFGTSNNDASNSGSLVFTDARLVCLPVRSMYGTFAWCTSPTVLRRFKRDAQSVEMDVVKNIPNVLQTEGLYAGTTELISEHQIYLEDLDIKAKPETDAQEWAEYFAKKIFPENMDEFVKRFVILHDDVFNFLCETGTEVAAHIKIASEKKTVAPGALWYEESLPAESILCGIIWCDRVYGGKHTQAELMDKFTQDVPMLQFGGKATTGKGIVRCLFDKKGEN